MEGTVLTSEALQRVKAEYEKFGKMVDFKAMNDGKGGQVLRAALTSFNC